MKKLQSVFGTIAIITIFVFNINAEIITLRDGETHDVLSIAKQHPIGVVVNTTPNPSRHGRTMAWLPYNNMTPADQQRFGFDQKKYDDYLQKMAEGDKTLADAPNATPNYRTPKAIGTVTQYVIPQTTTREQYLQQQMQNNPIQGNQASVQGASVVSPVVAGGVNSQAVAVATPSTYAGLSTQEAKASVPGGAVSVSPQGVGINTPIANVGISPYGVAVNTPVTNAVVSTNVVGVQTPVGGIYLTPGPVPEPMYYPAPTVVGSAGGVPLIYSQPVSGPSTIPDQIPLMGIPVGSAIQPVVIYSPVITATNCPQPTYPVVNGYVAGPVYANPVVYTGTVQQPVINYAGAFNPWMQSYGYSTYGYSANYGWSGNPYYYNGSCYGGYRGWGGGGWGGYRGGAYSGGGWYPYCR
jgi:hypothetical protein